MEKSIRRTPDSSRRIAAAGQTLRRTTNQKSIYNGNVRILNNIVQPNQIHASYPVVSNGKGNCLLAHTFPWGKKRSFI